MQGSTPPPGKTITFQNGSFRSFPKPRWAWSSISQFVPSLNVAQGGAGIGVAARASRYRHVGLGRDRRSMTFARMLEKTTADGIAVLHRSKLIYERHFGALKRHKSHISAED